LFDQSLPLHLLKGEEHGMDIYMFAESAERRTGVRPIFILPDDLRLVPDKNEKSGFKLCCLVRDNISSPSSRNSRHSNRFVYNGEILEEIYHVSLELHQRELRALEPEVLRQLTLRCFNDMRTIFLVHDKRMLGIVLQELDALVYKHSVLTEEQANTLRRGVTTSYLPGSSELEHFIKQCKEIPKIKDNFLLKPIRSGKGAGILFGDQVSAEEWQSRLQALRDPSLVSQQTTYIVQRQIKQPVFNVLLREREGLQRNYLVGTYHAVNGKYLGIGTWRSGPGRICAVSHGGAWLCSVMPRCDHPRSLPPVIDVTQKRLSFVSPLFFAAVCICLLYCFCPSYRIL
jgi:hypothetical protein